MAEKKDVNNQKGHRNRVRTRFLKAGLNGLLPHEILEMLLFYSIAQKNTKDLAYALIHHFGTLESVLSASYEELVEVDGVGHQTAVFLSFVGSLIKNETKEKDIRQPLDTSDKLGEYVVPLFENAKTENIVLVGLDEGYKHIRTVRISEGSFDSTAFNITKITRIVVSMGAHFVVIAHNHPRGLAFPSLQDVKATQKLKTALASVGVDLIDHLIVAHGDYVSMRDSGEKLYTLSQ